MGGALVVALAMGLGGCAGKGEDAGNALGNIFAYNSTKAPPIAQSRKTIDVVCPVVQVVDGKAAYRIYAGSDKTNTAVKQQYSMGELSRDCSAEDANLTIRVGISGYVQAGPAGGPGSFDVPVSVIVRREADQQPAAIKTYRIAATIAPGETSTTFALVTEPIAVPYIHEEADDDYSIYVGFDDGKPEAPRKITRKRQR